jgi:hypothetical protein
MCNDPAQLCRSSLTRVAPLISCLPFSAAVLAFSCTPAFPQSATPDGATASSAVETRHSLIIEDSELTDPTAK